MKVFVRPTGAPLGVGTTIGFAPNGSSASLDTAPQEGALEAGDLVLMQRAGALVKAPASLFGGGGGGGGGGSLLAGMQVARRTITSATTDAAGSADVCIFWNNAATAAKTQTLPTPSSGNDGTVYTVADEIGTAGTYPITVVSAGATVAGAASFPINRNGMAVTFVCDFPSNNWVPT